MENKLIRGAKIATIGLLLTKALGIVYVIPMNAMLSTKTMAMYGASYTVYAFFTQLTLIGFPVGVSKLVSKYQAQSNYSMVTKVYKYSTILMSIFAVLMFSLLFFFSEFVVDVIIGTNSEQYNINELTTSIRLLSLTLLVLPILAISRGFTQGFEDMLPSSKSMILEQFIRVALIVGGVFLVTKILNVNEVYAIYIASVASFFGAISGIFILIPGFKKYFSFANTNKKSSDNTTTFTNIIKMVAVISIPFIVLSTYKSVFELIDISTISRVLYYLKMPEGYIDQTTNIYTVQNQKLVILILTISSGFTLSLIPSLTVLQTKGKYQELKKRLTQIILLSFYIIIFISVFTAIFNEETFYVFFGYNKLGAEVFSVSIISAVFYAIFNVIAASLLTLQHFKEVAIALVLGVVSKVLFTVILAFTFKYISIEPAQIFAITSFIGYIFSLTYLLNRCYKYNLLAIRPLYKCSINILITIIATGIIIAILNLLLPSVSENSNSFTNYIVNALVLGISGIVTLIIYIVIANKMKYLSYISSTNLDKIINKILIKK